MVNAPNKCGCTADHRCEEALCLLAEADAAYERWCKAWSDRWHRTRSQTDWDEYVEKKAKYQEHVDNATGGG